VKASPEVTAYEHHHINHEAANPTRRRRAGIPYILSPMTGTAFFRDAPAPVPLIADAAKAAKVLAAAGAGQVIVFGSVARGESTPDSDINLLAAFDSLDDDHTNRHRTAEALQTAAEAAVGWECTVLVTTRPEWAARSNAPLSFERTISRDAVTLIDNPPDTVAERDKQPANPTATTQQALSHLENRLSARLDNMSKAMFPPRHKETSHPTASTPEAERLDHTQDLHENCVKTIQLSLQAHALLGNRHPIYKTLNLNTLQTKLLWNAAACTDDINTEHTEADSPVRDYAHTALAVAQTVAQQIANRSHNPEASVCLKKIKKMAARFHNQDIRYDRPLDPSPPAVTPPLPAAAGSSAVNRRLRRRARQLKLGGMGNKAIAAKLGITEAQAQEHTRGMPPGRN